MSSDAEELTSKAEVNGSAIVSEALHPSAFSHPDDGAFINVIFGRSLLGRANLLAGRGSSTQHTGSTGSAVNMATVRRSVIIQAKMDEIAHPV